MGEMADYYAELALQYSEELERLSDLDYLLDKRMWMMRNGKTIKISKMETSHLHNTINMVNRNNPKSRFLPILIEELKTRNL